MSVLVALFSTDETCIAMATTNEMKFNYLKRETKNPVLYAMNTSFEFMLGKTDVFT